MKGLQNRKYRSFFIAFVASIVFSINFKSYASDINSPHQENKICFDIDEVEIRDNGLLPQKIIKSIKNDYESKCLNADDINNFLRQLTNIYVREGFITTIPYIPEQNLKSRKLIIEVQVGKIEKTEYKSKRRISQDHVLPIASDKTLNLRDIEQSSDQFSSLGAGGKSKINIKPGSTPGTSIVEIDDSEQKVWKFTTGIDNHGTKNKGIEQSSTTIAVENLLKSNDRYSISHRQSLGDPRKRFTRTYTGGISIPYGYYNLNFNTSHSAYRTYINANKQKFRNSGSSRTYRFDLSGVVHRDNKGKTTANIAYGHDNFSNYIADARLEISSYRIDKFEAGINHQRRLSKSVIGAGLSYTYGINYNYLKTFGSFAKPHNKFHKINYNISWLKPLPMKPAIFKPRFTSSIVGQFTNQRLAGSEKISIGGISSVRGYKEKIENADNGTYLRNEVALGFISNKHNQNPFIQEAELFFGLDIGRFANYDQNKEVTGLMSGGAFGIRNNKGLVRFEAAIGKAIKAKYIKPKHTEFYFSVGIDV